MFVSNQIMVPDSVFYDVEVINTSSGYNLESNCILRRFFVLKLIELVNWIDRIKIVSLQHSSSL